MLNAHVSTFPLADMCSDTRGDEDFGRSSIMLMGEPSVGLCAVVLIDGDDLDLACYCMKPMVHDDRNRAFQKSLTA